MHTLKTLLNLRFLRRIFWIFGVKRKVSQWSLTRLRPTERQHLKGRKPIFGTSIIVFGSSRFIAEGNRPASWTRATSFLREVLFKVRRLIVVEDYRPWPGGKREGHWTVVTVIKLMKRRNGDITRYNIMSHGHVYCMAATVCTILNVLRKTKYG